ncbi:MAG: DUF4920 domain-containing protein [Myxococcota bacterium]
MNLLSILFIAACQTETTPKDQSHDGTMSKHSHDQANEAADHEEGHQPDGQVPPSPAVNADYTDFGTPLSVETITDADEFLNSPETFVGKTVRVSGNAADVCQKMGCWIVFSNGDKTMRVTTKDHGFFVDKQGAGRKCEVEGVVVSRQKDSERTAHFESEAGEGAPIPENEVVGETYFELEATGIRLYSASL